MIFKENRERSNDLISKIILNIKNKKYTDTEIIKRGSNNNNLFNLLFLLRKYKKKSIINRNTVNKCIFLN
jgi:hypothetical protein